METACWRPRDPDKISINLIDFEALHTRQAVKKVAVLLPSPLILTSNLGIILELFVNHDPRFVL